MALTSVAIVSLCSICAYPMYTNKLCHHVKIMNARLRLTLALFTVVDCVHKYLFKNGGGKVPVNLLPIATEPRKGLKSRITNCRTD